MFRVLLSLSLLSTTAIAADFPQLAAMGAPGKALEYEQTLELEITKKYFKEVRNHHQMVIELDNIIYIKQQYEVVTSKIQTHINALAQIQPFLTQMNNLLNQNNNAANVIAGAAAAAAPQNITEQSYQDKLATLTSILKPLSPDMREYNIYSEASSAQAAQLPSMIIDSLPLYCLDYIWTTLQGTSTLPGTLHNSQMVVTNLIHNLIPLEQQKLQGVQEKVTALLAIKQSGVLALRKAIKRSITLQQKYLKIIEDNFAHN